MRRITAVGAALLIAFRAHAQEAPPSVFLEELTTVEVEAAVAAGHTAILLPTAGTEQNGPHLAIGKHSYIVRYAAGRIANALGGTLVAPVVTYVPEGDVDPPTGHMRHPGTVTLPGEYFERLVEYAARSFRAHGFTDILFIADSGGNLPGMAAVAEALNDEWDGTGTRVHHIDDYYADNGYTAWLLTQGETAETIGSHAGLDTTSELLFVAPEHVRQNQLEAATAPRWGGAAGDPTRATVEYGEMGLRLKIGAAVRQARSLMGRR